MNSSHTPHTQKYRKGNFLAATDSEGSVCKALHLHLGHSGRNCQDNEKSQIPDLPREADELDLK